MPELPEVQTTVDGINARLKGLAITDVWTDYKSAHRTGKEDIKDPRFFAQFKKIVMGAKLVDASRRGKNVLISLSNGYTILIHMKMTGHLLYGMYEKRLDEEKRKEIWEAVGAGPLRDDPFNRHVRLVFSLSNGKRLALSDLRRFAKITVAKTADLPASEHLKGLGPEPLDPSFTYEAFKSRLDRRPNGPIKQVLMNHEIVAGIGNIYSDEILWRAGIHPLEKIKNAPSGKLLAAWKAMKETLKKGILLGGDSMSDYRNISGESGKFQAKHEAYRRTGEKCRKPGCAGTIQRIKVGGRSAHFCDVHQKLTRAS